MDGGVFCFGRFRLIVRERVLMKDHLPVSLGSRAFDLLVALVERAGKTVNREDLLQLVWPDVVVSKVNLRVHIASLRRVLGDGQNGDRFIVSVAGRGYRFVAGLSRFQPIAPETALSSSSKVPLHLRLERMFGRDAAIATLSSQLSRKRFISLGGPGGWGCTSVAFAIAHALATDFADAVCFVDCADIDHSDQVAMTVASALGCATKPNQSLICVLAFLRNKDMLLVFDNCDHVFAGVAQLTDVLFTEAPLVHVVVSSGEALRLSPTKYSARSSSAIADPAE